MKQELLQKYAQLIIETGINIQPEQVLFIQADVESAFFVKYCVEAAYKRGAQEVVVTYSDQNLIRLNFEYAKTEVLEQVPDYVLSRMEYLMDKKAARLNLLSVSPTLLEGIEPHKINAVNSAMVKQPIVQKMRQFSMNNTTQWCLAGVPSVAWAKQVFPQAQSDQEALEKMWEAILYTVRVNQESSPIDQWNKHNDILHKHNQLLNEYNFKSLVFTNSKGTNIEIGLVKNHVWAGGSEKALNGFVFNPNMPTEESFTMPDRNRVNGRVYSTKPLNYNGVLIDEFWLEFKDGKVVDFDAKENKESLANLLDTDEGARHIGEIALISHDSPISNLNILFYNTLYDENASCHMALGAAYPMNIKGGSTMDQETLLAQGGNVSHVHSDFMFGSSDMSIVGITYDNQHVTVFKDGNFVI